MFVCSHSTDSVKPHVIICSKYEHLQTFAAGGSVALTKQQTISFALLRMYLWNMLHRLYPKEMCHL